MEHVDYLYLLVHAHHLWNYQEDARKGGGEFHANERFYPLGELSVLLRIVRVNPSDDKPKLVLRIRHSRNPKHAEAVGKTAFQILGKELQRVPTPISSGDVVEHVFWTDDVPPDPSKVATPSPL